MRSMLVISCLVLIVIALKVYGNLNKVHQFEQKDCVLCHVDIENNKADLKTISASVCEKCHIDRKQKLSHPIEILPMKSIPADMTLADGKMSCITCHFVHPFSVNNIKFRKSFLRRPGRGIFFCSTCHKIDEKGHIVFERVHTGSYQVTNPNGTLDDYTLQCIECHDRSIDRTSHRTGSGKWEHFSLKLNHPVGITFSKLARKKPKQFNPSVSLPEEIRLFNGKIGCGTCHNVYSKERYILVTDNFQSRLCLQCHIE